MIHYLHQVRSHTSAPGTAAHGSSPARTSWHGITVNIQESNPLSVGTATEAFPAQTIWPCIVADTCWSEHTHSHTHTHGRAGSPPIVFSWAGYKNGHPCPWERKRERIKEQVKEEYNAFPTFAELNRVHSGREEAHLQAWNIWSPGCWLSHVCSKEYFTRTNRLFSDFSILSHPCVLFKHGCFSVNIYNVKKSRVEWLYVLFWQMQRGAWPGIVCLHSFLHLPFCGTSRARRICEGSCSSSGDGDFGSVIPDVSEGCHLQVNIPANEITQKTTYILVQYIFWSPQLLILNWNWFNLINRQNIYGLLQSTIQICLNYITPTH